MTIKQGEVKNPSGYKSFGNDRRGDNMPLVQEIDFKGRPNGRYPAKRANIHVIGVMKRDSESATHSYQLGTFSDWVDAVALKPQAMLWLVKYMKSTVSAELELIPVTVEIIDGNEFTLFYTDKFETLKLDILLRGDL